MEPIFILDVRDRATGKQVAVRLSAAEAKAPLGELAGRVLRTPPEELVRAGRLAPGQADTFFRLQDLLFPVDSRGALQRAPYRGLAWRHQQEGFPLDPARPALFERVRRAGAADVLVLPLEADRRDLRYDRNWRGFHARRYARFRPLVARLLDEALPDATALDGPEAERRFVETAARRIWRADFENYSRFLGIGAVDTPPRQAGTPSMPPAGRGCASPASGAAPETPAPPVRLKSGDETVENICAGRGGVCIEKVAALKFITDAHGLASSVVFAGPHTQAPLPVERLREMLDQLDTYDFTYARRYLRYWDHVALEYRLSDGSRWLVDPSNGNIPFLCAPAAAYLTRRGGRRTVPVRMVAVEEPVTYHRAPASLGLDFLFAWETWVADVDLMQVFDNRLGLLVAQDFFVTAAAWGSRTKRAVALEGWRRYAREHSLGIGLAKEAGGTEEESEPLAQFQALCPEQAAWCAAALPGVAQRYREYILARYGIDKPFGADLVILDRRMRHAACGMRNEERSSLAARPNPASECVADGMRNEV